MLLLKNLLSSLLGVVLCFSLAYTQKIADPLSPLKAEKRLINGPMPGWNSETEVSIWIQTAQPYEVRYRYKALEDSLWQDSEIGETTPETANTSIINIRGLKPNTRYEYQVVLGENTVVPLSKSYFQTQAPLSAEKKIKIAAGSCVNMVDKTLPKSHDRFLHVHGPYGIFKSIARRKPDYMLWLGDNIYLRNGEWQSREGFQYRYTHTRSNKKIQKLLRSTHHVATWDDHDCSANNGGKSSVNLDLAQQTFNQFWANPEQEEAHQGVANRFKIGDVEVFLTDDRSFREEPVQGDSTREFLGKKQIDHLLKGLAESSANFKMICIGTQILNSSTNLRTENYNRQYYNEYNYLFSELKRQKIEGVLFLSGDVHYSMLSRQKNPDFYPIYDITYSPLTSIANPIVGVKNKYRVAGTFVPIWNYGEMIVKGKGDKRRIIFACRTWFGMKLWRWKVYAKELKLQS